MNNKYVMVNEKHLNGISISEGSCSVVNDGSSIPTVVMTMLELDASNCGGNNSEEDEDTKHEPNNNSNNNNSNHNNNNSNSNNSNNGGSSGKNCGTKREAVVMPVLQPKTTIEYNVDKNDNVELTVVAGGIAGSAVDAEPAAKAILIPHHNTHKFFERTLSLRRQVKIGRSVAKTKPASDNAIFDCKVLSRHHAVLWYDKGKFFIKDTDSSNGTFINNHRIPEDRKEPDQVFSGDVVQFGVDVLDSDRTVTHGCIIAKLQLFLPNGQEVRRQNKNSCPAIGFVRDTMLGGNFSTSGPDADLALRLPVGSAIVSEAELYQLHHIIQEATRRERCFEMKLLGFQGHLAHVKKMVDENWQGCVERDKLLCHISNLELKLQQATSKDWTDDRIKSELRRLQSEKVEYQEAAKRELDQLHTERLEALAMAARQEQFRMFADQQVVMTNERFAQAQKTVENTMKQVEEERKRSLSMHESMKDQKQEYEKNINRIIGQINISENSNANDASVTFHITQNEDQVTTNLDDERFSKPTTDSKFIIERSNCENYDSSKIPNKGNYDQDDEPESSESYLDQSHESNEKCALEVAEKSQLHKYNEISDQDDVSVNENESVQSLESNTDPLSHSRDTHFPQRIDNQDDSREVVTDIDATDDIRSSSWYNNERGLHATIDDSNGSGSKICSEISCSPPLQVPFGCSYSNAELKRKNELLEAIADENALLIKELEQNLEREKALNEVRLNEYNKLASENETLQAQIADLLATNEKLRNENHRLICKYEKAQQNGSMATPTNHATTSHLQDVCLEAFVCGMTVDDKHATEQGSTNIRLNSVDNKTRRKSVDISSEFTEHDVDSNNVFTLKQFVALEEELVLLKERCAQLSQEKIKMKGDMKELREQYGRLCQGSGNRAYLFVIVPLIIVVFCVAFYSLVSTSSTS